jgi:DNA-binding XRE family transcriptional regulator
VEVNIMFINVDVELKRRKMTRGDLAKALGITRSTMSMKLNGKSPIYMSEAMRIKQILKTDLAIEDLFKPEVSAKDQVSA